VTIKVATCQDECIVAAAGGHIGCHTLLNSGLPAHPSTRLHPLAEITPHTCQI